MKTEWYQVHDNIVTLVTWMRDNEYSLDDVVYAVEKPWKYEEVFQKAVEANSTMTQLDRMMLNQKYGKSSRKELGVPGWVPGK